MKKSKKQVYAEKLYQDSLRLLYDQVYQIAKITKKKPTNYDIDAACKLLAGAYQLGVSEKILKALGVKR